VPHWSVPIAPLCRGDQDFESDITRFIDDPGLRQRILDVFHAAPAG
jgi:hypothetical protein